MDAWTRWEIIIGASINGGIAYTFTGNWWYAICYDALAIGVCCSFVSIFSSLWPCVLSFMSERLSSNKDTQTAST